MTELKSVARAVLDGLMVCGAAVYLAVGALVALVTQENIAWVGSILRGAIHRFLCGSAFLCELLHAGLGKARDAIGPILGPVAGSVLHSIQFEELARSILMGFLAGGLAGIPAQINEAAEKISPGHGLAVTIAAAGITTVFDLGRRYFHGPSTPS